MNAKKCDRCRELYELKTKLKEVDVPNYIRLYKQTIGGESYMGMYEFCPLCSKKLALFVSGGMERTLKVGDENEV